MPTVPAVKQVLVTRDLPVADELQFTLDTTVVIKPFSYYYPDVPIEQFTPFYHTLTDGSFVSPALVRDLRSTYLLLILSSFILTLFTVNIIRSWTFVARGKVKKKLLLRLCLLSQILSLPSMLPILSSYLNQYVNCTIAAYFATIGALLSLSILITGILGFKAYRCLENSRVVLAVLGLIRLSAIAVVGLMLSKMTGYRRLSGACSITQNQNLSFCYVCLQLLESLFICGCFLYAVYNSRGRPSIRGRISIRLSMEDNNYEPKISEQLDNVFSDAHAIQPSIPSIHSSAHARGWWDYVPAASTSPPPQPLEPLGPVSPAAQITNWWRSLVVNDGMNPPGLERKTSLASDAPLRPNPSFREHRMSLASSSQQSHSSRVHLTAKLTKDPPTSSGNRWSKGLFSSSRSTFSRMVPRMVLFKEVMRDELCYTTFIACSCAVVAILSAIAMRLPMTLSVNTWILCNWCLISCLTVHSFSRVVARHEREALLEHPSTWDPALRAERAMANHKKLTSPGGRWSPVSVSVASYHQRRRMPTSQSLSEGDIGSWRSFTCDSSSSLSSSPSPDTPLSINDGSRAVVLPSPLTGEFLVEDNIK